ncbi:MAG TPA: sortase [Actinomycetota bacterium]|nr:sortase [Actinomycetota bacterium]
MNLAARAPAAAGAAPRLVLHRWQAIALATLVPALLSGLYVSTNVRASLAQRSLRAQWEPAVAAGPVAPATLAARAFTPGEPVARLGIAATGADLIVVAGGNGARQGPALAAGSAYPGLPGVSVIEAGRFGYGNMFLHLDRLIPGDTIVVETLAGVRRFTVRSVRVLPASAIDPREDSVTPVLLLAAPARAWGSSDRIVVRAESAGAAR